MKLFIPVMLLISCSYYNSQTLLSLYGTGFVPSNNSVLGTNQNVTLTYKDITGSAYANKDFAMASVSSNYESVPVRYNTYTDQLEFKRGEEVMVLPKNITFAKIVFKDTKDVLLLLTVNDEPQGYYYELVEGKYSLYKKVKTQFVDIVPAATPYQTDQPARFKNASPVYYINTDNRFVNVNTLKKEKEIANQFPEKREALNTFLKQNKIKLEREEDLKKLVHFMNQN